MFAQREVLEMARNKHPEETVNLILEVAFQLFLEKGYERTSIQDIIDHLGGLSKGAIYHHFKSKEEILDAVTNRMMGSSNAMLAQIRDQEGLTGKEKLQKLFRASLLRPEHDNLFSMAPEFGDNSKLVYSIFRDTITVVTPEYILPIIEQGLADGSIQTDYPEELAELMMFAANVWMNPMMFHDTPQKSGRKFRLFGQMMKGFGLDIVDEELETRIQELTAIYNEHALAK